LSTITLAKTGIMIFSATMDSKTLGIIEGIEIGRQLEILDKSDYYFGTGRISVVFHASGKVPLDSNWLNR